MKNSLIKKERNVESIRFRISLSLTLFFIAVMWGVKLAEISLGHSFTHLGIYPQTFSGLKGIFFFPFIHGDFEHLFSNTFPILILLTGLFFFYPKNNFKILGIIYFASGALLWIIGRQSYHIGASGLIYALAAFHFFSGVLSRRNDFIALSLIVIFLYGSLIWGILPNIDKQISWEGHLSGFSVGAFLAIFYYPKKNIIFNNKKNELKINFIYFYDFKYSNSNIKNNSIYKYVEKKDKNNLENFNYTINENKNNSNSYTSDIYFDKYFWTK